MRSKIIAVAIALAALLSAVEARADPTGVCVDPRGCGGGGSGGGRQDDYEYREPKVYKPSRAELQQQQVVALQAQGLEQFRAGNYSAALGLFEQSLKLCVAADDIQNLRINIGNTRTYLGHLAYERGDLEQALREFEAAQKLIPDNAVNSDNVTAARNEIAARKRALEEQNRRERESEAIETAAKMRKKIEAFTASLDTAPPTAGLVVEKAGETADYMGTHKAKTPPLAFGSPDALEAASVQARQGFDRDGRLKGSTPVAPAGDEPASRDPQMITAEADLAKLKSDRMQLDAEIDKLAKERSAQADPAKAQELTLELDKKVEAKATKLVEIYKKEENNQKLRRTINTRVQGEAKK